MQSKVRKEIEAGTVEGLGRRDGTAGTGESPTAPRTRPSPAAARTNPAPRHTQPVPMPAAVAVPGAAATREHHGHDRAHGLKILFANDGCQRLAKQQT